MAFGWFATPERNAAGPGPDSVGIQRQGAKPPRRNRIFFMTKPGNQESSKKSHGFLPSLCGIVFGRAFAPLRLCVKSFWYGGRRQRPGRGRIQPECNVKAQSRQDATGFFLLRNQETRDHRKDFMVSGLPYGIVLGRAFAVLSPNFVAFCEDFPRARRSTGTEE